MANAEDIVAQLARNIVESGENAKTVDSHKYLKILIPILKEFPAILWDNPELYNLSRALMMGYHSDAFDDEDDNILLTHLAYLYICRAEELYIEDFMHDNNSIFDVLRIKVLLLKTCEDSFMHTISSFYLAKGGALDVDRQTAMRLANAIAPLIQYDVLLKIDSIYNGFNNDDLLDEICNDIELERTDISDKIMTEAAKINSMLYHYIKVKVGKGEFDF